MQRLKDKVAVVTGGNSGIGLATAKSYAREGAKVVIFGRNAETLETARQQVGEGTLAIQGDASNLADLERLFAEVEKAHGSVDVLFVNAGVAKFAPLEAVTEEFFDHQFGINVKGALFTLQKALPLLKEGSSVIFNTSVVNEQGMPNMTVYAATKAALRNIVRTTAGELVGRGIRVNAVSPGPVETPIFDRSGLPKEAIEEFGKSINEAVPMKRFGKPDEIAAAALFLASDDSSYMLGVEIPVDGGMSQI
jgi:NAD(P)-dependent dehydrogenase (short-subunit alcohol dehydrogenase family)